jgi:hypothetical protein
MTWFFVSLFFPSPSRPMFGGSLVTAGGFTVG